MEWFHLLAVLLIVQQFSCIKGDDIVLVGPGSYDDVSSECENEHDGKMLSIHDDETNDEAFEVCQTATQSHERVCLGGKMISQKCFIGIILHSHLTDEDDFEWDDGTDFDYSSWDDGEPDFSRSGENNVFIQDDGPVWHDIPGGCVMYGLCLKPSSSPACRSYEWECEDGSCIRSSYKCDGRDDCRDKSDESDRTCDPQGGSDDDGTCKNDDSFRSGFGDCESYAEGEDNHQFCDEDKDVRTDQLAEEMCCASCTQQSVDDDSSASGSPIPVTYIPDELPVEIENFTPFCSQITLHEIQDTSVRDRFQCLMTGDVQITDVDGRDIWVSGDGLPSSAVFVLPNGDVVWDLRSSVHIEIPRNSHGTIELRIESEPELCDAVIRIRDSEGAMGSCRFDCSFRDLRDCGGCTRLGGPCPCEFARECVCDWPNPDPDGEPFFDCCFGPGDEFWGEICATRASICGCEYEEHPRTDEMSSCCFDWSDECVERCESNYFDECWSANAFCTSDDYSRPEDSIECQLCCRTNERSQERWQCPHEECAIFEGLPCTRSSGCSSSISTDSFFTWELEFCRTYHCCEMSSRGQTQIWTYDALNGRCGFLDFEDVVFIDTQSNTAQNWVWGFPQDGDPDGMPADFCPDNTRKQFESVCGCSTLDTDKDGDGWIDCLEPPGCRTNPQLFEPPCESVCGNALLARDERGCDVVSTELCVCAFDQFCCDFEWTEECVFLAIEQCDCVNFCDIEISGTDDASGRYELDRTDFHDRHNFYRNIDSSDDLFLYFTDDSDRWVVSDRLGSGEIIFRSQVNDDVTAPENVGGTWQGSDGRNFENQNSASVECYAGSGGSCSDSSSWDAGFGGCDEYAPGGLNFGFCDDVDFRDGRSAFEACPVACDTCNSGGGGGQSCCWSEDFEADIPGYGYKQLFTETLIDCKQECCNEGGNDCGSIQFSETSADGQEFRCLLFRPNIEINSDASYKDFHVYIKTRCATGE